MTTDEFREKIALIGAGLRSGADSQARMWAQLAYTEVFGMQTDEAIERMACGHGRGEEGAMTKSKGVKSRTLLGYHVTVAGKLARVERALAKLPSTSKSAKVDKPKGK